MVVLTVEKPLLEVVMKHADDNQSRAAQWLGLNRNTLRKKLSEHHLL
jgi:Fis family transcriptional regulator